MDLCARRAQEFDIVHVQHEFGLYCGSGGLPESIRHFGHLLAALRKADRPAVVVFHTAPQFYALTADAAPDTAPANSYTLLRSYVRRWRSRRLAAGLHGLWRREVTPHFSGGPESFRGLALAGHVRLALVQSGCARESISLWPRGIVERNRLVLDRDPARAKAELGLAPDSVLLTIFGFVGDYKGHLVALQALKELPPRFHLAVLGGANINFPTDRTLNSMLEAWEGEDPRRLIVTGFASRETIDRYHAATDICLAPFRPNSCSGSGSICWSLSSGKPTFASNIPAFAEIRDEADCLLLCTPDAPHELAWQIQNLQEQPALKQRLVANALEFAARHSWDRVTPMLLDIYAQMGHPAQTTIPFPAGQRREKVRRAA
jgi:glycosyltransferase involved in cell wall biosynthesis